MYPLSQWSTCVCSSSSVLYKFFLNRKGVTRGTLSNDPVGTLQVFRAQLILHDKVREVFEGSLRLARESGYLQKRDMKVALDTTNILGRGAVKDTCNLLADGIVKLLRALAQLKGGRGGTAGPVAAPGRGAD